MYACPIAWGEPFSIQLLPGKRKRLVNGDELGHLGNISFMNIEHPDTWFLRKHENGEIFGPVPFEKIREWAVSAQVNPQDVLSTDKTVWTKAPMVPELAMDWLVVMGKDLLYGPTTAEALMEFVQMGEITPETLLINCANGETIALNKTAFYQSNAHPLRAKAEENREADLPPPQPVKGTIRMNLQKRIRELELALMEERRQLSQAEDNIHRLETKVHELEQRIRDYSGFKRTS